MNITNDNQDIEVQQVQTADSCFCGVKTRRRLKRKSVCIAVCENCTEFVEANWMYGDSDLTYFYREGEWRLLAHISLLPILKERGYLVREEAELPRCSFL